MTIRILCIVITLIVAVWVSREVNLSGGWTVIFTLLASAAVGFMAIIIPLNYEGYVTTAKSYETRVVSRYLAERTKPPDAGDDVLNRYANGGGGATSAKLAELKARLGK